MSLLSFAAALAVLVGSIVPATAQAADQAVKFEFERGGQAVKHWTIELHSDGTGTYTNIDAEPTAVQTIHVGPALGEKLHDVYAVVREGKCETKLKNIANTGKKALSYLPANGSTAAASCSFNFSDNDALNGVAESFLAISETMQAGERLAKKHRFDRLGLDAEIDGLIEEVKTGRASELGNIAPVLQSIANDERVMERVQRKAARLLQDAGVTAPPADSAR